MVLIVRWITILFAGLTLGVGSVVLWTYLRANTLVPRKVHVILVAFSYIGWVCVGLFHVIDAIIHQLPFHWWASPVMLVSAVLGWFGLIRFVGQDAAKRAAL